MGGSIGGNLVLEKGNLYKDGISSFKNRPQMGDRMNTKKENRHKKLDEGTFEPDSCN